MTVFVAVDASAAETFAFITDDMDRISEWLEQDSAHLYYEFNREPVDGEPIETPLSPNTLLSGAIDPQTAESVEFVTDDFDYISDWVHGTDRMYEKTSLVRGRLNRHEFGRYVYPPAPVSSTMGETRRPTDREMLTTTVVAALAALALVYLLGDFSMTYVYVGLWTVVGTLLMWVGITRFGGE